MELVTRAIDFHAHFPFGWKAPQHSPIVDDYARRRALRMKLEWDQPDQNRQAGKQEAIEFWKAEVDKYDLARVVFVTGGGNDELAEIVSYYPGRFMGFAHHSPDEPNVVDRMRHAIEDLGLSGYKIIAPRINTPFDDPGLDDLWKYIEHRRLPVIIHFGLLGHAGGVCTHPLTNPLTLARTAARFPGIPFVVPHFGCGYYRELLHLCWSNPNVYIDTSGSNQWMRWSPYPLTLESLFRTAYETVGPERIVFGTDSSWLPRGFSYRYLQDQVRVCRWLRMSESDIDLIFYGNAAALLGIG